MRMAAKVLATCMRQAKTDVAYALSRSSSTETAKFRRVYEHVTGITVRDEGKPSGFWPCQTRYRCDD